MRPKALFYAPFSSFISMEVARTARRLGAYMSTASQPASSSSGMRQWQQHNLELQGGCSGTVLHCSGIQQQGQMGMLLNDVASCAEAAAAAAAAAAAWGMEKSPPIMVPAQLFFLKYLPELTNFGILRVTQLAQVGMISQSY